MSTFFSYISILLSPNIIAATKTRTKFSNKFWNDIKEMGRIVSKSEGETVIEMSKLINNANVQIK